MLQYVWVSQGSVTKLDVAVDDKSAFSGDGRSLNARFLC